MSVLAPEPPVSEQGSLRVLIVEDHPIVAQGYLHLLASRPNFEVCGTAEGATQALQVAAETNPDFAIVDLSLAEGSGLELIKALRSQRPTIKVLAVSAHDDRLFAERVLRAGASGFVNKQCATQDLLRAIDRVLEGGIHLNDEMSQRVLTSLSGGPKAGDESPVQKLSNRELEAFEMIGQGLTTREIAHRMTVSPKTVERYREKYQEQAQAGERDRVGSHQHPVGSRESIDRSPWMKNRYLVVDAFASGPFTGNPAAVVLLKNWPDDAWLQNVAMEMNLSETAFLVGSHDRYHLRWFTPCVEVDLCGHATLASAVALADLGLLPDHSHVTFDTRSGQLVVSRVSKQYQMDFPAVRAQECPKPLGLIESLGVQAKCVAKNKFDYLVEVASPAEVVEARPNYSQLALVEARGVILTACDDSGRYDFVSRFFAPAAGINEDPVTGSAHCCLAHYWGERLGKSCMIGWQASKRGGIVQVELRDDRVVLSGQGFIFARGEFDL